MIYCRMATAASIFDFPDETDRLLAIQNIAEVALQASETALCNVNVSKVSLVFRHPIANIGGSWGTL